MTDVFGDIDVPKADRTYWRFDDWNSSPSPYKPQPKPQFNACIPGLPDAEKVMTLPGTEFAGLVIKDKDGNERVKAISEPLAPGDHTIQLFSANKNIGCRQVMIHVPKTDEKADNLPVLFTLRGVGGQKEEPSEIIAETAINSVADQPGQEFIAVYPMPRKHYLSARSMMPAYAWNADGLMLSNKDMHQAGYNDIDFMRSVVDLVPRITKANPTHENWGALGFSHGGLLLNNLVTKFPNTFPTVGLVATSMEDSRNYYVLEGNATNVTILFNQADRMVLPEKGNEGGVVKMIRFFHDQGMSDAARMYPLGPLRIDKQNPAKQADVYLKHLQEIGGDYKTTENTVLDPATNQTLLVKRESVSQSNPIFSVTEYHLKAAEHCWPRDASMDKEKRKCGGVDATKIFTDRFVRYNEAKRKP